MSLWKMIGFWVVALAALTAFFMVSASASVPPVLLVVALMAVAIAFVLISRRKRPGT